MALMYKRKNIFKKTILFFIAVSIGFTTFTATGVYADEPTKFLKGDLAANFVLNNIDYLDIKGAPSWSAPAIYETGALDIMKGYGSKLFAKDDIVTREQAIAIAVRLGGREADAKEAAEALDATRLPKDKIKEPFLYWSLGYLKIASEDGLITPEEYQEALLSNGKQGFNGQAPAQRQEMAFWIAKSLKLPPVYNEQAILNNFNDWQQTDADKIAYIEATLQNKIMNGNGNGSFLPKGSLTREQAAQIAKNSEKYLLPAMSLTKTVGTIEKIEPKTNVQNGQKVDSVDFYIRNIDGSLSLINVGFSANTWDYSKGEIDGSNKDKNLTDLVVYKNGILEGSGLLTTGDRIEYIYDLNSVVKYVSVLSSTLNTEYLVGQLKNMDVTTSTAFINTYFISDTPDIDLVQKFANLGFQYSIKQSFSYSKDAKFIVDGLSVAPTQFNRDDYVIVTVVNDVITKIQKFNPIYRSGETGVINGTVQDNNPSLGYITLYGQDGRGVGVNPITSDILRNYNYDSINGIDVYKDHVKATTKDIIPGDTVFLKLNDKGKVIQISAASNYSIKYGTIKSLGDSTLGIKYDDGKEQALITDSDTNWFNINGIKGKEGIKEGDSVILTLGISPSGTKVLEVRSSNVFSLVKNTYKGIIESYQGDINSIFLSDVKTLGKSSFDWISDRGIKKLPVSDSCKVYVDGIETPLYELSTINPFSSAYVVTKSDFGDNEKAIVITINTQQTSQLPVYTDDLEKLDILNGSIVLKNTQVSLPYKDETIFIKDGRLVNFNNLELDDAVSVASGYYRGINGGYAAVVIAGDKVNSDYFEIYRGRINGISDGANFSVKSFSQLEDSEFKYYNTGKSFDITAKTRLVDSAGSVSMRNFTVNGANSYYDKSVYIVAKNGEALLISTAPFSNMYSFKADIIKVSGNTVELSNGRIFNNTTKEWNLSKLNSVNILNNSVIIKKDKIIKPDELTKGDKIRLFKDGNSNIGNAYVIVVEG